MLDRYTAAARFLLFLTGSIIVLGCGVLSTQGQESGPNDPVNVGPLPNNQDYPPRWPMVIQLTNGPEVTVFQPQLEDFQGDVLKGRAAVQLSNAPDQQPLYGAVWLQSRVSTDRVARTVRVLDVQVTRSRFPEVNPQTVNMVSAAITRELTARPATLSLDQLLSMLQAVQQEQQQAENLQVTPPAIVFKDHPTVKVQYDGTPRLMQIENSPLMRVVNTPFFVVLDPASRSYFLKGAGHWFMASDPLGPFHDAQVIPEPVARLADSSGYQDPQQPIPAAQLRGLEIITATEPTELIWTDGPQQMATIPGTGLLYVINTDSNVFRLIDTQQIFVLLAGRWYVAPNQNGPWTFAPPDRLPPDFARIPPNSEKGDVLAHVAGTQAAEDAIADTMIPQTATIDRQHYEQPTVAYDGEPNFEPVQGAACSYAVNTESAVLLVNGRYYCCHNAVWYLSPRAIGPWELCTVVPTEIYTLPPSCPIYSVRYVYVYGYTPDWVYCGYTPGYTGCYRFNHVVVYGTGFHYRPWIGRIYCARPLTYGFAPHYNSYVGQWGFSFGLASGGGGGWIGRDARSWGRREPWFGFGGYRPVIEHKDIHVETFRNAYLTRVREGRPPAARSAQRDDYSRNLYDRRADVKRTALQDSNARRPEERRPGASQENARDTRPPNVRPEEARPDEARRGGTGAAQEPRGNDVYTDRSGNVYRRTGNGWETRDQGGWRAANANERPAQTPRERPAEAARASDRQQEPQRAPAQSERTTQPPARSGDAHETPQRQPDRSREQQPNPPRAQQSPSSDQRALNRDQQARDAGNNRLRNYERPANDRPSPPQQRSQERPSEPQRSAPPPQQAPSRAPDRSPPPSQQPSQRSDSGQPGRNGR